MNVQDFAAAFVGRLARDDFDAAGSLAAYLASPEARRGGDEADIVDLRVTATLISALGYANSERTYNRANSEGRPDYVVRIAAYPNPCFVVEDKNTTERRLESHQGQLASYMASVRAGRGLLINGERLLGYDDAGPASAPTLQMSLLALVRLWRGEDLLAGGAMGWDALPEADRDALSILLRRYGREAFQGVSRLVDDLTLDRDGNPHALDGSTWRPGRTREPLNSAAVAPDGLVEAVQSLIGELREDVAVQFAARMREFEAFEAEAAQAPGSGDALAANVISAITDRILSIMPGAQERRRDALALRLRQAMRGERPEADIEEVADEVRAAVGGTPPAMRTAVREARSFAGRYGRHLLRARSRHVAGIEAVEAYGRWKAAVGTVMLAGMAEDRARAEYFVQTAYLVVVRMLLVRVLEDKGLTRRIFTNGGAALWFREVEPHYFSLSRGRSAARLLEIAYENAQATYAHFYDDHRVFDWYVPDRNTVVRVLHRLAGYDLSAMDRDIVGTIYSRFVNEAHRHEQGMYYTPPSVVGFILDRVGWSGAETVGKRLLDPACGSGAFLVEAARRTVEAHRAAARAEGHAEIPPERIQAVLDSIREGFVGFDLNPFACALAEINLLIQVLDLVAHAHAHGQPAHLDRFRVHATDGLRVPPAAVAALEAGMDPAEARDLPEEDQAKLGIGLFEGGFDAVVGNPPYVRADEGAPGLLAYRRRLEEHPLSAVRDVLTMKWDLFIPFVALGAHLLRRPGGRLGMIVSNALETVSYARALRETLARDRAVREVHFFRPGVRLFQDAAVRNTILILGAETDPEGATLREWHADAPPAARERQRLPQADYGAEVFRPTLPALRVPVAATCHPLKHACYVSVGMVLNAHERLARGAFVLDDLIVATPDATHPKPYVGSADLRIADSPIGDFPFAPSRIRFLEHGTARVPALLRRPTFPELYDREKVMVGKFGGAVHDDGTLHPRGFLTCNHTVFMFLPWHSIAGVENDSLRDRLRELGRPREALELISLLYPAGFLVGLFNSKPWAAIIAGRVTEAIAGGSQPNDYADQPVPVPAPGLARDVAAAALAARTEGLALGALLAAGWRRDARGWHAPPSAPGATHAALAVARVRWGLTITRSSARCDALRRDGDLLLAGNRPAASFAPGVPDAAKDYLLRVLVAQGSAALGVAEAGGLTIPVDPTEAARAEATLRLQEQAAHAREDAILARRGEMDALLAPLFEAVPHPPVEVAEPS